ncbi:hypothetical protein Aasi_1559 [Candidatus Amoebophilus asiaticus 5a2]|uniref:TIGR02453 family protein n=1 Tax=Amoebophilus asiaticus (strain 5a2) TaxID=452471 RepID=C3L4H8_AMOA5|nr:hypothetical protein Aasi_1559 [Candidatus Amoebophilus asiaticus 5a2]
MEANKAVYQESRHTLLQVTEQLIQGIGKFDHDIALLTPANCIFRINRDIRFTKDKSPYKSNMGAYFAKGGKTGGYAGYYLHLQPNNQSFIAGGMYEPSAEALKKIRQEIDYNGDKLELIVEDKRFKELFGKLQGESLQRPPKGYNADHPHIDWLKLKTFIAVHPVTDVIVANQDFIDYTLKLFEALVPLNQFLNAALDDLE